MSRRQPPAAAAAVPRIAPQETVVDASDGLEHQAEPEQSVTPLELFFDLVFVFAVTQVTRYLAEDSTFDQLARGVLMLGALWWAWVGYSWLTNRMNSDEGPARLVMLAAMAAMLVAALATPRAFLGDATVFGVAYLTVRLLQIAGLVVLGDKGAEVRIAVRRLAVTATLGPALILLASGFTGLTQGLLWAAALLIDFGGGYLATRGEGEWHIHAGHFAERHGLIVIIALGESIVALGVGAEDLEVRGNVITAAVLGTALVGALWWAYFDVAAIVAERRLAAARGAERGELARDCYSYLHFVMVAGIILLALGIKKALAHADDPLQDMPAACLFGGTAAYFLGHVLFRLRSMRAVSGPRIAAIVLLAALSYPVGTHTDAIVSLAIVAAVAVAVVAYEAVRDATTRDQVRHALS